MTGDSLSPLLWLWLSWSSFIWGRLVFLDGCWCINLQFLWSFIFHLDIVPLYRVLCQSSLLLLLFLCDRLLIVVLIYSYRFFTLFQCKFMEKLNLSLQLTVLIDPNSRVWWLTCNEFEEWIDWNTLYEFSMTLECLNFHKFAWLDAPQNWSSVKWTRNQELRIFSPCEIYHIGRVTSKLSWMSPLYDLFFFTEFHWSQSESPYDDHLVVWSTCQELPIGWKSGTIDCRLVPAL
jgi:hypothetical protein